MVHTIQQAFDEFMKNYVNLDPQKVSAARSSRDNLLDNISEFDEHEGFFKLYSDINIQFGSFARKTKCRPLNDIDIMVGISAEGATFNGDDPWDNIHITASSSSIAQKDCCRDDGTLNSTQVLNRFKSKLSSVREYSHSEFHRNGEAIVLNLKSKEWSFDIVPCFTTVRQPDGRVYYLIPNGIGNWKKTDPVLDKDHVTQTNQLCSGRMLELIRLCKKWNETKNQGVIPSYLLETMIVHFCNEKKELTGYIDMNFRDALDYIVNHILFDVEDMKKIQGNINFLSSTQREACQSRIRTEHLRAQLAVQYELDGKIEKSFQCWGEIFGNEFPKYSE